MPQSNNIDDNDSILTSYCSVSRNDRKSRAQKRSICHDTVSNTTTTYRCTSTINKAETIVKGKKRKPRKATMSIEVNSHLISLLDKVVYEWFERAQRLIETGTITNEMFLEKAHEFKQIFGIPHFVTDYEWVWNFRKKYNITNLDMTMLRIDNDNRPLLSINIYDIVMFVLRNNAITEYFPNAAPANIQCISTESDLAIRETIRPTSDPIQNIQCCTNNNIDESIFPDNCQETVEVESEALPAITNDEQAKRYLKPLEDYVLLKENFRAIGLISQLEEIFSTAAT